MSMNYSKITTNRLAEKMATLSDEDQKKVKNAIRALDRYAEKAHFYALPFKANRATKFIVLTGAELKFAVRAVPEFFAFDENEVVWKGLQATKTSYDKIGLSAFTREMNRDFTCPWTKNDLKKGDDGTCSEDMEKRVAAFLTATGKLGNMEWKAVGHNISGRGYHPDVVGTDGTWIEIKGFNGILKSRQLVHF